MRTLRRALRDDTGSAALEAAVIAAPALAVIMLLVLGARIFMAGLAVEDAASQAARSSSIARDAGTAEAAAQTSAVTMLSTSGLSCAPNLALDLAGLGGEPGQPSTVSAEVSCDVDVSDLVFLPAVPGSITLTRGAASPVDTYRQRGS